MNLCSPEVQRKSIIRPVNFNTVDGFCRTMKEEKNIEMKKHMLDYVIALLEDANDFSGVR